jgi:shikimate kinase
MADVQEEGGCRIVLVGMMGSGKSTIGSALSATTGWPLIDNDVLLGRIFDKTARELLAEQGEIALRAAEADALTIGLTDPSPTIVDAAAGTILDETIRAALGKEFVVWLKASPEVLFRRSAGAAHRPWLDRGEDWFRTAVAQRDPLYESVADVTVDTETTSAAGAVEAIARALPARCRDTFGT